MLPTKAEEGGAPFRWADGPVTECFTNGQWLLLDNISEPLAVVTERLNSLLEVPASLHVTEHEVCASATHACAQPPIPAFAPPPPPMHLPEGPAGGSAVWQ